MNLRDLFDTCEETLMDLLARIDDGDEDALEELKKFKRYVEDLADMLGVLDDDETMESIKKKFEELDKKFNQFLMEIVKVVG